MWQDSSNVSPLSHYLEDQLVQGGTHLNFCNKQLLLLHSIPNFCIDVLYANCADYSTKINYYAFVFNMHHEAPRDFWVLILFRCNFFQIYELGNYYSFFGISRVTNFYLFIFLTEVVNFL